MSRFASAFAFAFAAVCCLSLAACSDSADHSDPQPRPKPKPRTALKFGQTATVAGALKGTVQITAETIVYAEKAESSVPEHDVFAIVRYETGNRSTSSVTQLGETAFQWKTPNGKKIQAGNTSAAQGIAPIGFSEGSRRVSPKTSQADTVAFDLTEADKGGTLVYVDGDKVTFTWKMPSADSGSSAKALKIALD
ncbi:hypothetical protein [Streptomyces sp. NPDC059009]|uniref:hypothetical protein n=1 Tax=Streptomyces sp. NPDC059009 TaxID=3346694 RepID=UPI0036920168